MIDDLIAPKDEFIGVGELARLKEEREKWRRKKKDTATKRQRYNTMTEILKEWPNRIV